MYDGPSKFRRYSIGIVAKDIIEDDDVIECFPLENMTHIDGDISEQKTFSNKNITIDDENEVIVIKRGVSIKAKWIPLLDSNRVFAPNVKKGEQIQIYRYADIDEFYWTTMYNDFDLRRNEKVKKYYSNTGVFKEDLHDDNTYWSLIDTINKKVHFHTSDNDGEHTTYDINIDTKKGILSIVDGKGNEFIFDSSKDTLTANINEKIVLNTKVIEYNATTSLTINTPKLIENATTSKVVTTPELTETVSSLKTLTTPELVTKTDKTTHTIGTVDYKGGTIKHDGISIDKIHTHIGNLGFDTSSPNN